LIRNIVDQQNTHGTSVVSSRDRPEALLTGSVPDLQLHPLPIQLNRPDFEVNSDGCDERWGERIFAEAK
jgi:hypothetical protein